jgi:hypothetical protein
MAYKNRNWDVVDLCWKCTEGHVLNADKDHISQADEKTSGKPGEI